MMARRRGVVVCYVDAPARLVHLEDNAEKQHFIFLLDFCPVELSFFFFSLNAAKIKVNDDDLEYVWCYSHTCKI